MLQLRRLFISISLLLLIFHLAIAQDNSTTPDNPSKWQFLGAPYITADSDNGVIFGVGTGIAKQPNLALIINTSVSTTGLAGFTVRGEAASRNYRYIMKNAIWKFPTNIYSFQGAFPDWQVTSLLQHTEIQWAFLRKISPNFEMGPEIWTDFAKGLSPEDPDGNSVAVSNIPRLRDGSLALGGIRARYRTTSAVRPMDGVIIDFAIRAGRADGVMFTQPKFTTTADLWTAFAKPLSKRSKLYMRGWFRYQDQAAPSVRNGIGGIYSLRGQPYSRDYGRRLISTRIQYHYRLVDHVNIRAIRKVLPFIPEWDLQFEVAPFADIGAVADSDFNGWHRTRQGYGISLRFILPPDLIFFLDLAMSPGGKQQFYFGGGESL
jgi:hypothetical protein